MIGIKIDESVDACDDEELSWCRNRMVNGQVGRMQGIQSLGENDFDDGPSVAGKRERIYLCRWIICSQH